MRSPHWGTCMIWSPCADGVRTYTERFMCQNRRTKPSTYILALANSKTSNSVSCVCSSHETVLSTRRHPVHPVSVPILPPREIQALWSQNHDTEILHCNAVSRVDNAMTERRSKERNKNKNRKMYSSTWY